MSRYHTAHLLIEAAGKKRVTDLAAKHGLTEDEIRAMAEFDPSKNDKFLGWIAAQAAAGELSIPGDGPALKALLEEGLVENIDMWTFSELTEHRTMCETWKKPKTDKTPDDVKQRRLVSELDSLEEQPRWAVLKAKLLSLGGDSVSMYMEEDLERIIKRGIALKGHRARMERGEPCACHSNAAYLWDANRDSVNIMTGYALSKDGCWRQHTWAVMKDLQTPVETTTRRALYFGFVLTADESEVFLTKN